MHIYNLCYFHSLSPSKNFLQIVVWWILLIYFILPSSFLEWFWRRWIEPSCSHPFPSLLVLFIPLDSLLLLYDFMSYIHMILSVRIKSGIHKWENVTFCPSGSDLIHLIWYLLVTSFFLQMMQFILPSHWTKFHCVHRPHFHPFLSWETSRLTL